MSVVVAYTPDAFGEAALDHGATEARKLETGLVVANATRSGGFADTGYADAEEMEVALVGRGGADLEVSVRRDATADLADLVIHVAQETGAALVVVGIRRRSPVGKAIMGDAAQRIVLDAPCPVLTVKPAG